MSAPQPQANFGELLSKIILPKVHLIALLVAVTGIIFHYQQLAGAADILMIGLSTLAGVYFLSAFTVNNQPDNKHSPRALLVLKLIFMAASVAVIGILFTLLNLEGNQQMLLIGTGVLGIASIAGATLIVTNNSNLAILKRPLMVGIPLFLVALYFMYKLSII
ncbi:MAG: hypothetical protein J0L66_04055 [Cytophagales bacterium]|nr:hypothetical protein [Cytophagales bacterium]